MAERTLDRYLREGMKSLWRGAVKHSDAFTGGIADVSAFLPGIGNVWVENKELDDWPKRAKTKVALGLRDDQKLFLLERHGFLLLRVSREYLLFGWEDAYWLVEHSTQAEMRNFALATWKGKIEWEQFSRILRHESLAKVDV